MKSLREGVPSFEFSCINKLPLKYVDIRPFISLEKVDNMASYGVVGKSIDATLGVRFPCFRWRQDVPNTTYWVSVVTICVAKRGVSFAASFSVTSWGLPAKYGRIYYQLWWIFGSDTRELRTETVATTCCDGSYTASSWLCLKLRSKMKQGVSRYVDIFDVI